jgi:S-formylglutathione hydrolase FrmB
MGGHGALYNAFKHQDIFGAAGSMSGGVDLRPFPKNWELSDKLGTYAKYPDRWDANSVIDLTYLLTPQSLSLIIDCGTEDFFYGVNKKLHEKLLDMNIQHDFILRPGGHTWQYWSNSIQYQLLFFSNFFNKRR